MRGRRSRLRRVRTAGAVLAALWALSAAGMAQAAEWVPLRDDSLVVKAGSPLDFSGFEPSWPAGTQGRVVAGPSGHLAFASQPDKPVRFLCASLAWSAASGNFPDHATADLYAMQLRLHGYNMARFTYADMILMLGRGKDYDYNPEQLDNFRYLLAALKRQGIYWMVDGMSSEEGALGDAAWDRWKEKGDLKLDVFYDARARQAWSREVETLLAAVNPYTGLAPLADPAMAVVLFVNENGIEFDGMVKFPRDRQAYPPRLLARFNQWLAARYRTTDALRGAWPDLKAGERIEAANVAFPASWDDRGPRMRDTQSFIRALQADTTAWMTAEIRRLGYPGLVTQYNNQVNTALSFSRATLPLVAQDTYFEEVDDFQPGSAITQKSSIEDGLGYLRAIMGTRWLDRPFVVSEWGHVFWNRYRHEGGVAVPAYAALQGWDAICQHGPGAVDLDYHEPYQQKRSLLPYGVGQDPITRASETLAALLFRRGDVAQAPDAVRVPFGAESDMLGDGRDPLPDALTRLGLLTRVGLVPHRDDEAGRPLTIPLSAVAATAPKTGLGTIAAWFDGASAATGGVSRLDALTGRLRQDGVLKPGNRTDAGAGRFESETGQIRLDSGERRLEVVTPRTEAISISTLRAPERLGAMTIESASGPLMIAVSALDGAPLRDSGRLLVIMATDAENTGMSFRDAGRKVLETMGHFPVRIERQTVRFRLDVANASGWHLRSLHLDGSPGDELPLAPGPVLRMTLDNTAPSHGPTTFFSLERHG